jgi:D-beta-D-heptose 7-phosphate kinase/D-beta-D-heptose 1-phosphate adenosyltransferase
MSRLQLHEKILSLPALLHRYARPREGTLVFTNGCFDLLHRGHVEYLFAARALGDALVIGLSTDDSVRRLKGAGRPVTSELDRAVVLAGLACVNAITLFDEDTPRDLISVLLPDILVKGGDYRPDQIVGKTEVESVGGRVVVLPYLAGHSTTEILHRTGQTR